MSGLGSPEEFIVLMMKKLSLISMLLMLCVSIMAQSVTLTFTGKDANNNRVQLDRVSITNLTKGWQETIYWPDTTLTMQNGTGIDDYANNDGFVLSQNNPNPFDGTTNVLLTVADAGMVVLEIADANGRIVGTHRVRTQLGTHLFRVTLSAAGTYVMTARQNGKTSSIKMVNNGGGNGNDIKYTGIVETPYYDVSTMVTPKSGTRGNTNNPFNFGDMMEYVGYATINGTEYESERISQMQGASQTFVLQFGLVYPEQDGEPCPNMPTLTDIDGNVYNTVQIGLQCWMKENLRTSKYADNMPIPEGNTYSYTEPYRYAPDNNESNVPTYGYLYNWAAVMNGASSSNANPSGVQGICPTGWHVPSDAEWTQFTDYVSSKSQYQCNSSSINIGKALADTTGWRSNTTICAVGNMPSTNNATGFSALPAGYYYDSGYYVFGFCAYFWSATDDGIHYAWHRYLLHNLEGVCLGGQFTGYGYSVRCLRD